MVAQLRKMVGLLKTEFAASLLFSCLMAVLAFVAGMKKEQIPDYLPTVFSTQYLPSMFTAQNVSLEVQYDEKGCPTLPSSAQIFSLDPLVIYIRNFISPSEREYLKNLGSVFSSPQARQN